MDGPEKIEPPPGETEGGSENNQTPINNTKCGDEQESEKADKPALPQNGTQPPPSSGHDGYPATSLGVVVSENFDFEMLPSGSSPPAISDSTDIAAAKIVCVCIQVPFFVPMLKIVGLAKACLGRTPLAGIDHYPIDLLVYRSCDPVPDLVWSDMYICGHRVRVKILTYSEYLAALSADPVSRYCREWAARDPSEVLMDELPIVSKEGLEAFRNGVVKVLREEGASESPYHELVNVGARKEQDVRDEFYQVPCGGYDDWFILGCILAHGFEDHAEVGSAIFDDFVSTSENYEGAAHARDAYDSYWDCSHWWDKYKTLDVAQAVPPSDPVSSLTGISSISFEDGPQAWPEPKPIVAELKPAPAFDAEALLPPVLRDLVADEADRMPCLPDYVAVAALVALGSVIGGCCAVRPKKSDPWPVMPNLWGAIVGEPGAKKSPAWSAGMKPLDRLSAKALETYKTRLLAHELADVIKKTRKEAIKNLFKHPEKLDDGAIDNLKQEDGALDTEGAPKRSLSFQARRRSRNMSFLP